MAGTLILPNGRIEFPRRHAPVMEAVAAPLDHLAVDRGRLVVRLDQLDVHVTGKAHRERNIRLRGLPAVDGVDAREVLEDKPRADPKLRGPFADRRRQVGDDVGHLMMPSSGWPNPTWPMAHPPYGDRFEA